MRYAMTRKDQLHVPFGMLHDPAILGPGEPARSLLGVVGSVEDADGVWGIGAACLWNAPDAQIAVGSLRGQHVGLLFLRRSVPCELCDWRRRSCRRECMKDCESRLQVGNEYATIKVPILRSELKLVGRHSLWSIKSKAWKMNSCTNPIANVLQSVRGAKAVIGSKMVRLETCSEVEGSKRMTLPCEFPAKQSVCRFP